MSKEIFVALSGGIAYQKQLEIVSNNLANVSTVGFKADRPVFSVAQPDFAALGLKQYPAGSPGNLLAHSYAALPFSYTDMEGGELNQTGNPNDMALQSEGFFTVQGPNDELLYTRNGQFHVTSQGALVTAGGLPVMGEQGEIKIQGKDVRIDGSGMISVDGQLVDRLRIEGFAATDQLDKRGDNMFVPAGNATPTRVTDASVVQGALEQSNVDPVRGMVDLITVQRNFESFTKVVSSIDELEKKVNSRVKV